MSEVTLIRNPESPVVVIQPTTTTITAPDNMDAAETATQAALEANLARNDAQASATAADNHRIASQTAQAGAEAAQDAAEAASDSASDAADRASIASLILDGGTAFSQFSNGPGFDLGSAT